MSLYKPETSRFWWFQIWLPGKKRVRRSTGTDDIDKATSIEHTFAMAYGRRTTPERLHAMIDAVCGSDKKGLPLGEVWSTYCQWLTMSGRAIAPETLRKRQNSLNRFTTWAKENWPAAPVVEAVDRQVASAFALMLATTGTKGKTRRNIFGDLGTVWQVLMRVRDDLKNPWPLVRPEANDSERGQPFTRDQEKAVLEEAAKGAADWHLASIIARHTGLRYSSVARLTWKEVDLETGVIRHTPPKTARHNIEVLLPLAQPLKEALAKAWADREKPETLMRRPGATSSMKPLDPAHVLPLHAACYPRPHLMGGPGPFADVLTAAKVGEGFTFHSWRHTFRTRLSEAGVSDDLAKRLGGWTEDATAARYDHAERVEELREAVEKAWAQPKAKAGGEPARQEDQAHAKVADGAAADNG